MNDSEPLGYTLWAVLRRDPNRPAEIVGLEAAVDALAAHDITVRGFYDVSGLRADADLMIWLHGAVAGAAAVRRCASCGARRARRLAADLERDGRAP